MWRRCPRRNEAGPFGSDSFLKRQSPFYLSVLLAHKEHAHTLALPVALAHNPRSANARTNPEATRRLGTHLRGGATPSVTCSTSSSEGWMNGRETGACSPRHLGRRAILDILGRQGGGEDVKLGCVEGRHLAIRGAMRRTNLELQEGSVLAAVRWSRRVELEVPANASWALAGKAAGRRGAAHSGSMASHRPKTRD